jgi:predicted dehydrogenase
MAGLSFLPLLLVNPQLALAFKMNSALSAAARILPVSMSGAPPSTTPVAHPIRLCLIGLGEIADVYLDRIQDELTEEVSVVAGINRSEKKLEKLPEGAKGFTSIDDFLQSGIHADAALVMAPTSLHQKMTSQLLNAGLHVLLEKPASMSMPELDGLYALADKQKLKLMVAMHGAKAGDVNWIRANKHKWGKLKSVRARFTDAYVKEDGSLEPGTTSKYGSWLDSGVNAITAMATALDSPITMTKLSRDQHGVEEVDDVSAIAHFTVCGGVDGELVTEWRVAAGADGRKEVTYAFEHANVTAIDSERRVIVDCEEALGRGEAIRPDLLVERYCFVLKDLIKALSGDEEVARANRDSALSVHRALFSDYEAGCLKCS